MEKREYGPDSTEAEVEMLKSRVESLGNGIIFFNKALVISEFQIDVMWAEVKKLATENETSYILIDLVDTAHPNARQRAKIREHIKRLSNDIKYAAIYTEQNKLVNLVAKFIMGGAGFMDSSIHVTREQALKAIEDVRDS